MSLEATRTKPNPMPTSYDQACAILKKDLVKQNDELASFLQLQAAHAVMVATQCSCRTVDAIAKGEDKVQYGLSESHPYHPTNVAEALARAMVRSPM